MCFFHKKCSFTLLQILKITSTLSPLLKMTEFIDMDILFILKVELLDTRFLLLLSKVHS